MAQKISLLVYWEVMVMLEIWCKVLGIIFLNLVDIVCIIDYYRDTREIPLDIALMAAATDLIIVIS